MKVCHITSAHPAHDIRIYHKECISVAKAGHEVILIAVNCKASNQNGVQVVNVESNASGRFSRMLKSTNLVYKKALALNADVYHFHDPEFLRFGLKLKRKGKKVIYDAHEDVPRQIMAKFWIPKFLRKLVSRVFEIYEEYCAKRFDAVITSTLFIKERFLKVNKNSMEVCNYPLLHEVELELNREDVGSEICYVGGLTESRGIITLLDSLKYVPTVKLNLAGRFSEGDTLKTSAQQHESWNRVNFKGFVDRTGLIQIFEKSRIGMVTLLPTPNHMEALPIKMFEYMGASIPVIASNFPLWERIIKDADCGICVDPADPKKISEVVEKLLNDPKESERLGANGKKAILEKYNWGIEANKLLHVYSQISNDENEMD
jgi:glycosyltransferase involved in cell wall biosynthesis